MSLDVYLRRPGGHTEMPHARIFIRENGENRELTRDEWDQRFPGRESVVVLPDDDDEVYSANITHNLARMASVAGLYEPLWRPEEIGATLARQLIEPLERGLALLTSDPAAFEEYNPSNGWGSYDGLVSFTRRYLAACKAHPDATVEVSR